MRLLSALVVSFVALAVPAAAAPRVVADIAPVAGLVARVMEGVGAPALLVRPGLSPHDMSLRPSDAAALEGAALVVWIGPELTPWLEKPLSALAGGAARLELLESDGTHRLPLREADGQPAGGTDPHAWLDPANGARWLDLIAGALAGIDPANAELYRRNAAAGKDEIAASVADAAASLAPLKGRKIAAYHDAFQYFEARFGLDDIGSVSPGDAAPPGAARIAALRDRLTRENVACLLAEPETDPAKARAIAAGTPARVVVADPLGYGLTLGPGFYPSLIRRLGEEIGGCSAPG